MIYLPNQKPPIWSIDPGIVAYNYQKHGFPHPVLDMPMWEGAGPLARDYSGHGNHGAIYGAPWVGSERGWSLDFDGNDYVEMADSSQWDVDSVSLVARIKSDATNIVQSIIDRDEISGRQFQFRITNANKLQFIPFFNSEADTDNIGATTIADGNWHQVAVTYQAGSGLLKLYVDGSQDYSETEAGVALDKENSPLLIGIHGSQKNQEFNGLIDDVQIFNTALSAAQVKFLYENQYFMYQMPEELYGYVSGTPPENSPTSIFYGPFWGPFMGPIG